MLGWIYWRKGIHSKECWGKQCSKWYAWPDSKLLTKDSNNKAEVLCWRTFVILYWMYWKCNDVRLDGNRPSLKTICASWSLRIKQAAQRILIYLLGCLVEPERRQYAAVEAVRPQFWGRRPNWSLLQDIGPPALLPSTSIKKINFIQVADFQRSSQKRPQRLAYHWFISLFSGEEISLAWSLNNYRTLTPNNRKNYFLKIFWYFRISIWQYLDPLPLSGKILDQCSLDQSPPLDTKSGRGGDFEFAAALSLATVIILEKSGAAVNL